MQPAASKSRAIALDNIEEWTGRLIDTGTVFAGDGIAYERGELLIRQSASAAFGDFVALCPGETLVAQGSPSQ